MCGYDRQNSDKIGFAKACLFKNAITTEEFKKWINTLIEQYDELPLYIYDLANFDGNKSQLGKIIGFTPHWNASEDEEFAIYGIAFKRGFEPYDSPLTREEAMEALSRCSHIEGNFREMFSFATI